MVRAERRAVVARSIGLVAGAIFGWFPGAAIGDATADSEGLDGIVNSLIGGGVGAWLGAIIGVAIATAVVRADLGGSALFWTLVLAGPILGGSIWLAVSLTDYDDNVPLVVEYGIPVVGFALTVVGGRTLARMRATRGLEP